AAAAGPHSITLKNGTRTASLTDGFTVLVSMVATPIAPTSPTMSLPSIKQVSPNTAAQGANNLNVTLTGFATSWVNGTTKADFGPGITLVGALNIRSATEASAVVQVDPTATLGAHSVTLTTGAQIARLSNGFTVTAPITSGQYRIVINGFRVNNETN